MEVVAVVRVEEGRLFNVSDMVQASLYDDLAVWIETCIAFVQYASQQDQKLM